MKICLLVIFNHKYCKNIPILRETYKTRFSHMFFVVPFFDEQQDFKSVDGITDDIITVYESSYSFQGFIAYAYDRLKNMSFDKYVFIADDLLLNPCLNENNILESMGIGENDSYIKDIIPYGNAGGNSPSRLFQNTVPFRHDCGVNYASEIPDYNSAVNICKKHGYDINACLRFNISKNRRNFIKPKGIAVTLATLFINKSFKLPYPLFKGYSDFLIVDKSSIAEFAKLCGVFSAMGLFVETAIPLCYVLVCPRGTIKLEKDIKMVGKEFWNNEISDFENKHNCLLQSLCNDFGEKILYYHPIKLSKWK